MPKPNLTRAAFKAWLEAKAPGQIVGHKGSSCLCPVACFLTETGPCSFSVGLTHYVECGGHHGVAALPGWAMNFISRADREEEEEVTREKALIILNQYA